MKDKLNYAVIETDILPLSLIDKFKIALLRLILPKQIIVEFERKHFDKRLGKALGRP